MEPAGDNSRCHRGREGEGHGWTTPKTARRKKGGRDCEDGTVHINSCAWPLEIYTENNNANALLLLHLGKSRCAFPPWLYRPPIYLPFSWKPTQSGNSLVLLHGDDGLPDERGRFREDGGPDGRPGVSPPMMMMTTMDCGFRREYTHAVDIQTTWIACGPSFWQGSCRA